MDFDSIITQMLSTKAFDNYAKPLGETNASLFLPGSHNPAFPGDPLNKPINEKVPADLILANRHSYEDAIALYMPQPLMIQWMHEYFSGNFLSSSLFSQLLTIVSFLEPEKCDVLDSSFSMQLDAPERTRYDRKLYTLDELRVTQAVCAQKPTLALTVIAYQAAFAEYLQNLREAMTFSTQLSAEQRSRGLGIVGRLTQLWTNDNFIDFVLPALAIHYYKNHQGKLSEAPTCEDFTQSMSFAVRNGIFRQNFISSGNEKKLSACPARGIIARTSMIAIAEPSANAHSGNSMGTALFHIFREIDKAVIQNTHTASEAIKLLRAKLFPASNLTPLLR